MKNFVIKLILAWIFSSFFGIFVLSSGSSKSFTTIAIPYWILYAVVYQFWVIIAYLVVQGILLFFNIMDKNVFLGVGLVGLLFNFILNKFKNISTTGDFLFYLPSFVLILVGVIYWFWTRNK